MLDLAPSSVVLRSGVAEPALLPGSTAPPERAPLGRWRRRLDAPTPKRARVPWIVALLLHAGVLGGGVLFFPESPLRIGEGSEGNLVVHAMADAPALEPEAHVPDEAEQTPVRPDELLEPAELDPSEAVESTPLPAEEADLPPEEVAASLRPETPFPSLEGLVKLRVAPRVAAPPSSPTPAAATSAAPVAAPPPLPSPVASGRAQLRPRFRPVPVYPEALRQAGIEGVVALRIVVEADGTVSDARVATSSGFLDFDRAAVETIRRWRFEAPGERRSVDAVPIRFRLR